MPCHEIFSRNYPGTKADRCVTRQKGLFMDNKKKHDQPLDYIVVLDFEATCDERNSPSPQEVIEFPSVLVSMQTLDPVDEFVSFVRPQHHPELTRFCMELTGIKQEQVDMAHAFPQVLENHLDWLRSHNLPVTIDETGPEYALALCGDWDLGTMFPNQCKACTPPLEKIPLPYRQWVNIKRPFAKWRGTSKASGMPGMLRGLGLELTGRHHRGIDDCRNIAKIVKALVEKGQVFEITTKLSLSRYGSLNVILTKDNVSYDLALEKRSLTKLLGRACGLFRCQVLRAFRVDGREITRDDDLFDLDSNTELIVTDGKEYKLNDYTDHHS